MKFIFFLSLLIGTNALANQVTPKSFGVQYISKSISGDPFVNYTFTIAANNFPSMDFGNLSAKLVDNISHSLIVKPRIIYGKSPGTTIVGSEAITFSFVGLEALYNLKNLKNSSLVFDGDDGSSFSINLSNLCISSPGSFFNLYGDSGCDLDTKEIDKLIKEIESVASAEKPVSSLACGDVKELQPLVKLFCSPDMKAGKELAESDFNCSFNCK